MKKAKHKKFLLIMILSLSFVIEANAKLMLYEGFDYTEYEGIANKGTSDDLGWAGAWGSSSDLVAVSPSLSMTNYGFTTTGNQVVGPSSATRSINTSPSISLAADATYYVSVLFSSEGWTSSTSGEWFNFQLCDSSGIIGHFGKGSNESVLIGSSLGTGSDANGAATYNTMLFVYKIAASASSSDRVCLKVYVDPNDIPYTEPATSSDWSIYGSAVTSSAVISNIRLSGGSGDGSFAWRVDEIRIGTSWDDVVKVNPYLAYNAVPEEYDTSVEVSSQLKWAPGSSVKATGGHQLYFGTDRDAVTNATVSNPLGVYQGALDVNTFEPDLQYAKTYYWRVDEVSDTNTYTGHVWNFTTLDSALVDSFETYGSDANLTTAWTAASGATISLQSTDANYIYDGSAALQYVYNGVSAATLTLAAPADWSNDGDLKVIDIHFRGIAGNSTSGQLYVTVEDSSSNKATIYYDSSSNLASTSWQVFYAELDSIASTVDLSSVNKFTIGFTSGTGTVYFDSIKIYPCRSEGSVGMDFNSDCVVDFTDFAIFTEQWLEKKYY